MMRGTPSSRGSFMSIVKKSVPSSPLPMFSWRSLQAEPFSIKVKHHCNLNVASSSCAESRCVTKDIAQRSMPQCASAQPSITSSQLRQCNLYDHAPRLMHIAAYSSEQAKIASACTYTNLAWPDGHSHHTMDAHLCEPRPILESLTCMALRYCHPTMSQKLCNTVSQPSWDLISKPAAYRWQVSRVTPILDLSSTWSIMYLRSSASFSCRCSWACRCRRRRMYSCKLC